MGRMAVDIVLLPDEAMTMRVIEINRQLVTDGSQEIVLGTEERRPHISLAMGCIDKVGLEPIQERLVDLARNAQVRQLKIVGVLNSPNARGETTALLEVENTEELQALHEQVMDEMKPFFGYDVTEAMIADDRVTGTILDWVRTYPQKAAYEHFRPHITVGHGRVPAGLSLPISFTVVQLAVCHLGNHGTCRRIIGEWNVGIME